MTRKTKGKELFLHQEPQSLWPTAGWEVTHQFGSVGKTPLIVNRLKPSSAVPNCVPL
jgi:hypothetical protein